MTIILFIVALLGIAYGIVGMIINSASASKKAAYTSSGSRGNAPELVFLPAVKVILSLSAVLFAIMLFFSLFVVKIDGPKVGVLSTPSGVSEEPLHTGWHIIAPWNNVHTLDKTVWVYTFSQSKKDGNRPDEDAIWAPTKEGFKLGYDVSITWRIDANQAPWIYQNISGDLNNDTSRYRWIEDNIVRSDTKSAMTSITKNYDVISAYSTKRDEIQKTVFDILNKEMKKRRLILEAVNIREVHYNKDFETAINNKKLAEQEALRLVDVTRQKNELLTQAKIDKDIAIQQAEGEAKALQIKGESINKNPKVIELNLIEKWDGKLPETLINGGNNGQSLLLNLAK